MGSEGIRTMKCTNIPNLSSAPVPQLTVMATRGITYNQLKEEEKS